MRILFLGAGTSTGNDIDTGPRFVTFSNIFLLGAMHQTKSDAVRVTDLGAGNRFGTGTGSSV
jgi:hypothetical protein